MRPTLFFLVLIFCLAKADIAFAQDLSNPGDYMTAVSNAQTEMNKKYMIYMSAAAHERKAKKVDKLRQQALESIDNSRYKTIELPIYKGDNTLRQSSIDYIKLCYNVFNDDYEKIINMEDIAEQSFDEMQAFILLQEKTNEKINEANDKMDIASKAFATKYNIELIDSKGELSDKLNKAGTLNHYKNQLYLVFFKCYWQDGEIVKAMNTGKITNAEQGRTSLIRYADEGLAGLDSLKNFNNDPSLANSCRQILQFYKNMAEKYLPEQIDYFLKNENFGKVKKTFEAKSGEDLTKTEVQAFNAGVKEINKATNAYNETNKKVNTGRNDALNRWNEAEKNFTDKHMPYYK